jgi:thiol-disulfide isomerase/thioredoxin
MDEDKLRVVCLCAGWCGVCRDYRATFDAASAAFGDSVGARAVFSWFDIEDDAALLDDVDVENFPTLLIGRGQRTLFFGTITPQPATLARLVQRALEGELRPLGDAPEADAFVGRLSDISGP